MILPSMQSLMGGLGMEKKEEKEGSPPSLKDLAARLQTVDARCVKAKAAEGQLATKMKAKTKLSAIHAVFAKYDKDKDSLLSSKEVKAYAKGEFNFTLALKAVDSIMAKLGGESGKGV